MAFMTIQDIKIINIPDYPGVYFFKHGSKILYIGKATSLADRVKSYFVTDVTLSRGPKIVKMLDEATAISWQKTDSVLEALILESQLIKKHSPIYNTREKDDKSYNYVLITEETFPRIFTIRERELLQKGHSFILKNERMKESFGPFPHGTQLREALAIIRKIFPFRDKKAADKNQDRFYQMLGLSPNISSDIAQKEYAKTIRNIILFFQGKKEKILHALEKDMHIYAKKREFEKANDIKKQLFALQHIQDVALIHDDAKQVANQNFRIEAYDVAHLGGASSVGVMTVVIDGELEKNDYRKFILHQPIQGSDTHALREILERRFNHSEWRYPNLIVVDGSVAQKNVAEKFLIKIGSTIPVVALTKDEHHKPKEIRGNKKLAQTFEKEILLANAEAHRFAITFHRNKINKLKK